MQRILSLALMCFFLWGSQRVCARQYTQENLRQNIDSLQLLIPTLEQDSAKAIAYLKLSANYKAADEIGNFMQSSEKALLWAQKEGNPSRIASAYGMRGQLYLEQGQLPEALQLLQEAVKYSKEGGKIAQQATFVSFVGKVYEMQQQFDQAEAFYQEAYQSVNYITDSAQYAGSASFALNNLGNIATLKGDHKKALDYQFKSVEIRQKAIERKQMSPANLGFSYNDIACIYFAMDSMPEAKRYFNMAMDIFRPLGSKWMIANVNQSLSDVAYRTGQIDEAKILSEAALQMAQEVKTFNTIIAASLRLSEIAEKQGRFQDALNYHKLFHAFSDSINNQEKAKELGRLESKAQLEKMDLENKRQQEVIEQQQTTNIIVGTGLAIVLGLAGLLFRSQQQQRQANKRLQLQNEEINQQKEEIQLQAETLKAANEEINQQKEEIYSQAEYLRRANEEIQSSHENLQLTHTLLEKKNKDVMASIQYASRIQKALLPLDRRMAQALPEHFILFQPRDIVSGDFYWFNTVGNLSIMAVGDCTGHGVPGALMAMLGNGALDDIVLRRGITEPSRILQALDIAIRTVLQQDDTDNKDGMDIAIVAIDREKKVLQYAGAKNPLFYLQQGEPQLIKADKHPIAGHEFGEKKQFVSQSISWQEAPITAFLYSDGYQDQFGGPDDRKLMAKNFRDLLAKNASLPMEAQQSALKSHLKAWIGKGHQLDDILVVGFRLI